MENKLNQILEKLNEIDGKLSLYGWRIEKLEKETSEMWCQFDKIEDNLHRITNIIAYSSGAVIVIITLLNLIVPAILKRFLGG